MAVPRQAVSPYEVHKAAVLAVLAQRCSWLDPGDREGIFHDAYAFVLEKERDGELDLEQMHDHQLRAYLIRTALNKALDEGKRAERRLTTALDDVAFRQPDLGAKTEERVASSMDGAPVREIVAELPARQQAIVKLRFYFERSPQEVQRLLGMTERTYRRQLERAMKKIATRYELVLSGEWCDSHRDLIIAYVGGLTESEEARQAVLHMRSCPGCARMAAELRVATRRTAALLPLPVLPHADGPFARLADQSAAGREWIADSVHNAARQVASLFGRVDPAAISYATTARPGALGSTLAACLVLGGTTSYCVIEGVPEPIRAVLGVEQASSKGGDASEPGPKQKPKPTAPQTPVPAVITPPPNPAAPAAGAPSPNTQQGGAGGGGSSSSSERGDGGDASVAPAPAPAPAPEPEFSPEAPATPPPSSSPAPAPAPGRGGGGGGGGGGGEFDF